MNEEKGKLNCEICKHGNLNAQVLVDHLDSGQFQANVCIHCTLCGVPFRFIGLPCGVDLNGATTNPDATEARLSIAPEREVVPLIEGAPTKFSIRARRFPRQRRR